MTKKLEELFNLPSASDSPTTAPLPTTQETLQELDNTIDKIEAALPMVKGLDTSDAEMDELAQLAVDGYKDLTDLGMQVDSRYASEIFAVAGQMLGHAITAKNAKLTKKLKMIELQLKKAKLDQDSGDEADRLPTAQGHILDRNELLRTLIAKDSEGSKS